MKKNFLFQFILFVFLGFALTSCRYEIEVLNEVPTHVDGSDHNHDKDGHDHEGDGQDHDHEKGHDNWAKVEIIIRQGHLHGSNFHGNPETNNPIIPIVQKVIFEQTPQGVERRIEKGNTLRKDNGMIEVIADSDQGARYAMEIIYYNSAGERINYQYMTPEQLPIHQHFFTIDKYSDLKTGKEYSAAKTTFFTNLHSYVYRDTNPEDQMFGQGGQLLNNPVGLKGYFLFKKPSTRTKFDLVVRLNHFKGSKFDVNGKADDAINPSQRARLNSVTDFYQKIPIIVIGYNGLTPEENDQYFKDLAEYYGISEEQVEEYILESDVDPEKGTFWM